MRIGRTLHGAGLLLVVWASLGCNTPSISDDCAPSGATTEEMLAGNRYCVQRGTLVATLQPGTPVRLPMRLEGGETSIQYCFIDDNAENHRARVLHGEREELMVAHNRCVTQTVEDPNADRTLVLEHDVDPTVDATPDLVHVRYFAPRSAPSWLIDTTALSVDPERATVLFTVNRCEGCSLDGIHWPKLYTDDQGLHRGFLGDYPGASFAQSACEGAAVCELSGADSAFNFAGARFDRARIRAGYLRVGTILPQYARTLSPFNGASFANMDAPTAALVLSNVRGASFDHATFGLLKVPTLDLPAVNQLRADFTQTTILNASQVTHANLDVGTFVSLLNVGVFLRDNVVEIPAEVTNLDNVELDGNQNQVLWPTSAGASNLEGRSFVGARLSNLAFPEHASLTHADFSGSILNRVSCPKCDLRGMRADNASFLDYAAPEAILDGTYLRLHAAQLALEGASLVDVSIDMDEPGTLQLDDARAEGIRVTSKEVSLSARSADLRRAQFLGMVLPYAALGHARIDGADFSGSTFAGGSLADVVGGGVSFVGAQFLGTRFRMSRLDAANFRGARCVGCAMDQVVLCGSDLSAMTFEGADLYGSLIPWSSNVFATDGGSGIPCAATFGVDRIFSDAATICPDGSHGMCLELQWLPPNAVTSCCDPRTDLACVRASAGTVCTSGCGCTSLQCSQGVCQ